MLYERDEDHGGNGGGPRNPPRASVALTAKQWSAIVFAVSHGVAVIKDSKKIPVRIISEALKDIADALPEIQKRMDCEALRRGEK